MNRAIKQCVISFNLGDGYQGIQTYLTVIAAISIIKCSVMTSTFNDNNTCTIFRIKWNLYSMRIQCKFSEPNEHYNCWLLDLRRFVMQTWK